MSGDKTDLRQVIAINTTQALALLEDGTKIPIIHWIDEDGQVCLSHDDAMIAAVAGSEAVGWWAIDLSGYVHLEREKMH